MKWSSLTTYGLLKSKFLFWVEGKHFSKDQRGAFTQSTKALHQFTFY